MAEIAVAMFSAMSTAAAGATAAAGTAAASATAMLPGIGAAAASAGAGSGLMAAGSSALGVLQGLATAGSVISTLVGGVGAFASGMQSAQQAKLQGEAEQIASQEASARIRRDMVQKIGDARVAFAASGLDISSADAVTSDLTSEANYQTEIERNNAAIRQAQARMRARQYRTNAMFDMAGSIAKAGGQVADFGLDVARRG